jgi:hypothetical protein
LQSWAAGKAAVHGVGAVGNDNFKEELSMIKLAYAGETEFNNTKGLIFNATFFGNYGVAGAGDLLNLTPSQNNGADGGVTDPNFSYNEILNQPPTNFAILNEDIGGSYVALHPNAVPTLKNLGLIMYEPGGTEKTTAAAYTAGELAGTVKLVVYLPAFN